MITCQDFCNILHPGNTPFHTINPENVKLALVFSCVYESTGFGGALKNIGMGGGSRAGKMHQHKSGTPKVDPSLCRGCRRCAKECGSDAISYGEDGKAFIDPGICRGCGRCIGACAFDAIENIPKTTQCAWIPRPTPSASCAL